MTAPGTVRVAVVGAGPRGLWAVEELTAQAAAHRVPVSVEVWDPSPAGAGSAYGPGQPDHWTMNVSSSIVRTAAGSFDGWRRSRGEALPLDPFPPRSLVGEFFAWSWRVLLSGLPRGCTVRHVRDRVTSVEPADGGDGSDGWSLTCGDGVHLYDEVLLATGHAARWPGMLPRDARTCGVYPPGELSAVAPGSRTVVRGTALTFIDAALELTVGRGGSFVPAADVGPGVRAGSGGRHDLVYVRSGREPAAIVPVGRRGRFMEVKPDPRLPLASVSAQDALTAGRARARICGELAELREVVADYAVVLLDRVRGTGSHDEVTAVLDGTDGDDGPSGGSRTQSRQAVEELRRSRDIAVGDLPPGPAWAVGQAFRQLYPAVVDRVADTTRPELTGFRALAATLERVAFGPTPGNASRLLALIDEGIVDCGCLTGIVAPEGTDKTAGRGADRDADRDADHVVDAVLAPPGVTRGSLVDCLVDGPVDGPARRTSPACTTGGRRAPGESGTTVLPPDGSVPGYTHLTVVGRDVEPRRPGADTLSRRLHDVIPRWAQRVIRDHGRTTVKDTRAHATVPLTGRLEPWMAELLEDPDTVSSLLDDHGSPVNVHHTAPVLRNAGELVGAGRDCGVDVRVFLARKANKILTAVDTAAAAGHGIDVAGDRELRQVLARGVPGERVILSAAVKPLELIDAAVRAGVTVSADTPAEAERVRRAAISAGVTARVAPRIAPDPSTLPATRFGASPHEWIRWMEDTGSGCGGDSLTVCGMHVHLHGYSAADRRTALGQALTVVDAAGELGHRPEFVDLGGGVPMSYLDDAEQWEAFLRERARVAVRDSGMPADEGFTWKDDPLRTIYPFHQGPVRGGWLRDLLTGPVAVGDVTATAADALTGRGLRLHLEPGRSVLDGVGMTLARVAFLKERSDGVPLIGLEMNRTQCRTTSDDFLADPVLVRCGPGTGRTGARSGFLVGAYCIEDEVILRRRVTFPDGVEVGDVVALPNTGGYYMHILESASHQIPLAVNLVTAESTGVPGTHGTGGRVSRGRGADQGTVFPPLRFIVDPVDR